MKTLRVVALLTFVWALFAGVSATAQSVTGPTSLYRVQKIYLEELGTSAEAARFRLLLEEKLVDKGFTIVQRAEDADAVLSGALSVSASRVYGGTSDVGVTVQLKSRAGDRLWSGNFAGQIITINPVAYFKFKDIVEHRASETAKKLRNDWLKSAKADGVKVRR
jgi:hypothetical protein